MSKMRRKRKLHQPPEELVHALRLPAAQRKLSGNRARRQTNAEARLDWLAGIESTRRSSRL